MTALRVTIVLARPDAAHVIELAVAPGTTVAQAVRQSGLMQREPSLDVAAAAFGVWNRRVPGERLVRDGDRIEVYRPLTIDPKDARRHRAELRRRRPRS